ncbi:MAG: ribokinase [Chloroflexi bacterium]|nr:ribokinase [Chloroflexota bacterium]
MEENILKFNANQPVLVIGAGGLDIVGQLKSDFRMGVSNPAKIRTSFGGVGRNVAENLARLGQPVVLLSIVGDDERGNRLLNQARQAGINVDFVLRTSQHPTGSYVGIISSNGQLQCAIDDMRSMTCMSVDYIKQHAHLFKSASMLFVDMNIPGDVLKTIISTARRAGLPICADPTSASLAYRLKPYLHRLLLMTPNAEEAAIYCGDLGKITNRRQALEAAKFLVSKGVTIVVITMGEQGLCYATSETSGFIPAIKTTIIDPTGAGDALTATLIFGLLNNIPIDDAVRLGVSAASLTLRHSGAVVPDLSLEKLYDQLVI